MDNNFNEFRLTIAIPTYNRADKLLIALNAIINEISKYEEKIEILVSDNNSIDNTFNIVESLQYKHEISYYKNSSNLGFDANVNIAIKRSKANFVLLLSDDDILIENSLKDYLSIIDSKSDIAVVIGKAKFMDYDMKKEITTFTDSAFNNFKSNKTYFFNNGYELMKFTEKLFCGISGVMFNRKKYMEEDVSQFIGSQFIHTAAIFKILAKEKSNVSIINKQVLMYRLGDEKNTKIKSQDEIVLVGFGLLDLLLKVKADYPFNIWSKLYNKELNWVRRLLVGIKSRENLKNKILNQYITLLNDKRDNRILDYFIIYFPDYLFKIPYLIYRIIKYKKLGY